MKITSIELHTFISVLVTLIKFQSHTRVRTKHEKDIFPVLDTSRLSSCSSCPLLQPVAGDTEAQGEEEEERSGYTSQQRTQVKVGIDFETYFMYMYLTFQ